VYEYFAEDCTRAAEQTDDPVFREMLLKLAEQWRQDAAREASTAIDRERRLLRPLSRRG
jgi:hypothetical protein